MKISSIIGLIFFVTIGVLFACSCGQSKTDDFSSIINDPRVNTKEVGLRKGIEYFQVIENGKCGFRDLDGNIVIKPQFDHAEMFSEGYSAVTVGDKWGLIDKTGNYLIKPQYEYLGGVHGGLMSFRQNDKYGFINLKNEVVIKPQFDWVDEFSEGLCAVRNDNGKPGSGKNGYIDTTGKVVIDFLFQYAGKFENGKANVHLEGKKQIIDKTGKNASS